MEKQEMKLLILWFTFLPCLWASEVRNIMCPDGKECPFGKTCCELPNGVFECCNLPEEERLNKKLIPASPYHSTNNMSNASPEGALSAYFEYYCPAGQTQCGMFCCEQSQGVCCSNPLYCCTEGTRCCSNYYAQRPWCCLSRYRCHMSYGYCIAGASSVSVTILSLLLALVFVAVSKY